MIKISKIAHRLIKQHVCVMTGGGTSAVRRTVRTAATEGPGAVP